VTRDRERTLALLSEARVHDYRDIKQHYAKCPEFADVRDDPEFLAGGSAGGLAPDSVARASKLGFQHFGGLDQRVVEGSSLLSRVDHGGDKGGSIPVFWRRSARRLRSKP